MPTLTLAQGAAVDELLGRDPLALLIGMLSTSTCAKEAVTGDAAAARP